MKKPTSIIFIVCNSGLGHFRRCVRIASQLLADIPNLQLAVYCHPQKLALTKGWPALENLRTGGNVEFHALLQTPQLLRNESEYTRELLFEWQNELPYAAIMEADIVVSDNLPGILQWRQDAVLMGSFLWSEILPLIYPNNSLIQEFAAMELSLLSKFEPNMICLKDMAMDYVRNFTHPIETGWVIEHEMPAMRSENTVKNILVSAGATGLDEEILVAMAATIAENPQYHVHTSSRVLDKLKAAAPNISLFDFQARSFLQMDLMIARPGIGSITDAIAFNIPFIATGGSYNPELSFNATKIAELNYGLNYQGNADGILAAMQGIFEPNEYRRIQHAIAAASRDGANDTVSFFQQQFNLSAITPNA